MLLTSFRLRLLLLGGLGTAAADPGTPLRVLRSAPSQHAAPTAAVTVTFDRPVAGSLDRTVDPRQILAIDPAVAGRAEWRDPVTLRFRPAAPLTPGTTYRVTVADRFEAMDGSRLAAPYTYSFRVRGPRVLSGVTGAAPLMHRTVLRVARRCAPGALRAPRDVGALPLSVCRLSGLRATHRCPQMTEWMPPARELPGPCDWHGADGVRLPDEYAEWEGSVALQQGSSAGSRTSGATAMHADSARRSAAFRIISPRDGDRYRLPPGVPPRYATMPVRASGVDVVRWSVDGREVAGERWTPVPGSHVVMAETGTGVREQVRIEVYR